MHVSSSCHFVYWISKLNKTLLILLHYGEYRCFSTLNFHTIQQEFHFKPKWQAHSYLFFCMLILSRCLLTKMSLINFPLASVNVWFSILKEIGRPWIVVLWILISITFKDMWSNLADSLMLVAHDTELYHPATSSQQKIRFSFCLCYLHFCLCW